MKSDNCALYYQQRPILYCAGYRPSFRMSFFFGDPHFTTLDGQNFTFNGLGEYTMLVHKEGNLTVQARTVQGSNAAGQPIQATVIAATAIFFNVFIPDTSSILTGILEVGLSTDKSELTFLVNKNVDRSSDTNSATDTKETDLFGGAVSYAVRNGEFVIFVNYLGSAFYFRAAAKQLQVSYSIDSSFQNQVEGLLGNFNDNPADDLLSKGATTPLDPQKATPQDVFTFGESWRIKCDSSYFTYPMGKVCADFQNPNFVPVYVVDFGSDAAEKTKAEKLCQSAPTDTVKDNCIFDYFVTRDSQVANATLRAGIDAHDIQTALDLSVPAIVGPPGHVEFTVGVKSSFELHVYNVPSPQLQLNTTPSGSSITSLNNNGTFKFEWTPGNIGEVYLEFIATDASTTEVGVYKAMVKLCNCKNNGTCRFDDVLNASKSNDYFKLVGCNCIVDQYTDDFCEAKMNLCEEYQPCGNGTRCTNISAVPFYECGSCLDGYTNATGGVGKCVDIDECMNASSCPANSKCTNTDGSFLCECNSGFIKLANGTCEDIDECYLDLHNCQQKCTNNDGGYTCSCYNMYDVDVNNCTLKNGSSCNCTAPAFCMSASQCACPSGYGLSNDKCVDNNECGDHDDHKCEYKAGCKNTIGSYDCGCPAGEKLDDDMRSCIDCSPGFWGENCNKTCKCGTADCNSTDGCTKCDEGFGGYDCVDNNECEKANPCGFGTCNNTVGGYWCDCLSGYEFDGTNCKGIDSCNAYTPCQNNGNCTSTGAGTYECQCPDEYVGTNCTKDVDICKAGGDLCFNGGTCEDQPYLYRCKCPPGYTGYRCENVVTNETTTVAPPLDSGFPTIGIVLAAIGGVVGVLIGVFTALAIYQKVKLRSFKMDRMPDTPSDYSGTYPRNPGRRWAPRSDAYTASPYAPNPYAQSPYAPNMPQQRPQPAPINWNMLRNAQQSQMRPTGFPSSAPYYGAQLGQKPKTFSWSEAP